VYSVYALNDPRTGKTRWVGCTGNVKRRYYAHIHKRDKSNLSRQAWIDELNGLGLRPAMVIIEENLSKQDALAREVYWLQWHVRHESPLTNMRDADKCADELWLGTDKWLQWQHSHFRVWNRGEHI